MEYLTIGREQPDWKVALVHSEKELGLEQGAGEAFRLVLIESGSGILRIGKRRHTILSPSVYYLNDQDEPLLEQSLDLKGRTLYFHPNVINSSFRSFDYFRGEMKDLTISSSQDLGCLRPFLNRGDEFYGYLTVGPSTGRRIGLLMDSVNRQMTEQIGGWPCRGRSYFLELLFLLERVYDSREQTGEVVLLEQSDMDPVILYLHTHYKEKVTLEGLTKVFHINRTSLIERFYKATGQSIKEYLIQLRLRLASLMLRDTLLPISEIMDRVGFKDLTHFGRMFRRYAGITPSDYRQQFCWMLEFYPGYRD